MPANIHQPAANSPAEWYYSLPPITRLYGTVCVAATVLSLLGLLNPMQLYLSWPLVFGKLQVRQYWLGVFILIIGQLTCCRCIAS